MSWKSLTGEPLAIDLVNTVTSTATDDVDLLDSPRALREWLTVQQDRLTAQPPADVATLTSDDVEAVRALRTVISEALTAARTGDAPPQSALTTLTATQQAAPAYLEAIWTGAAVTAEPRRTGAPAAVLLADLAAAAVSLLGDPVVQTVRECDGPHCRQLFVPTNPRRRWCRPSVCGNRARVARYYEAHKD